MELFGDNGYPNTSTAMIAKHAKVSEALIFKHFHTKEGLLRAVLKTGYSEVILSNKGMLNEKDPLALVFKVLELPSHLVNKHPIFWKMQARMMNQPAAKEAHANFMQPVHKLLVEAFDEIGYPKPIMETELLLLIVDALWKQLVKDPDFDCDTMITFVQQKYSQEQLPR